MTEPLQYLHPPVIRPIQTDHGILKFIQDILVLIRASEHTIDVLFILDLLAMGEEDLCIFECFAFDFADHQLDNRVHLC